MGDFSILDLYCNIDFPAYYHGEAADTVGKRKRRPQRRHNPTRPGRAPPWRPLGGSLEVELDRRRRSTSDSNSTTATRSWFWQRDDEPVGWHDYPSGTGESDDSAGTSRASGNWHDPNGNPELPR